MFAGKEAGEGMEVVFEHRGLSVPPLCKVTKPGLSLI